MWDSLNLALAGVVTFLNIVGVSIPQWVNRDSPRTDFGGRRQVGLLEYPSEYSGWHLKWAAVMELLAIFCMVVVFFLLFLKAFMGKSDKRIHLGAMGLSAFSGALMVIGPYLFCYDPGFNSPEDEPEEMGQAMHLCIASGIIAIGNAVLMAVRYFNCIDY